nr:helix-turn-helix domain-containing protein [uncultured Cohaesibacter sp.]
MGAVQVIRDEDGKPAFAVVPWTEYVSLCPNAEEAFLSDEELYDKSKSEEGEYFPESVANALFSGENPVSVFRKYRNLTQAQLAEITGLNKVYISQIETGKRSGSTETIRSIADALRISVDDLI